MSGAVARWTTALAWLTHPVYVVAGMPMSWGDIAGFLTGIVNVWLAARAHVWNFHFGILNAAILGLVALGFATFTLVLSQLLGRPRPNPAKSAVYECGVPSVKNACERVNVKFFLLCMIFILLDVDAAFLYPWALVFRQIGVS